MRAQYLSSFTFQSCASSCKGVHEDFCDACPADDVACNACHTCLADHNIQYYNIRDATCLSLVQYGILCVWSPGSPFGHRSLDVCAAPALASRRCMSWRHSPPAASLTFTAASPCTGLQPPCVFVCVPCARVLTDGAVCRQAGAGHCRASVEHDDSTAESCHRVLDAIPHQARAGRIRGVRGSSGVDGGGLSLQRDADARACRHLKCTLSSATCLRLTSVARLSALVRTAARFALHAVACCACCRRWVTRACRRRPDNCGIYFGGGLASASLVFVQSLGWRNTSVVMGIAGVAVVVCFACVVFEPPRVRPVV